MLILNQRNKDSQTFILSISILISKKYGNLRGKGTILSHISLKFLVPYRHPLVENQIHSAVKPYDKFIEKGEQ
jgi:hypothetical protein